MFTKDNRTEIFLTQLGVAWSYSNAIKYSDLVNGWDTRNLGRPKPQNDDAITEYAALMDGGSPAPAPILNAVGRGRYDVLDGVQRLCAGRMVDTTTISAYVVSTDSEVMLDEIRLIANLRLQGRQEPPEWTRRKAVEVLVVQRKVSAAEVARLGGWSAAEISKLAQVIEFGYTIKCAGGPALPDSLVDVVARHTTHAELAQHAEPICQFLSTVKQAKFSADDAVPHVEAFFRKDVKHTHSLFQKRLQQFSDDPEVEVRIKGRSGYRVPPDISLRRTLRSAATIVDGMDAAPAGIDEFFRLLKAIERGLRDLSKRHPAKQSAPTPADRWSKNAQG